MSVTSLFSFTSPAVKRFLAWKQCDIEEKMVREDFCCIGEKTEEEEGRLGGAGEVPELPQAAQSLCHQPSPAGQQAAGLQLDGTASFHLLPYVVLARSSEPP
ncbi:Mothers against decapentaplegic-like protein 1 [Sciurus carolinensis]|uniref:Mothers against decapentaplegic-like protein 1 n=1 Tax=Sciurus carolinensis TaxID=30640 RepID=A0AA41MN15_SCICA|nr:Mothers against decapentaplegic-like protein 1 [Sciurus carolinensis]